MEGKSKEEIIAERKLRKAAKQSKKKNIANKNISQSRENIVINDSQKKLGEVDNSSNKLSGSTTLKIDVPTSETCSFPSKFSVISAELTTTPDEYLTNSNACTPSSNDVKDTDASSQKNSVSEVSLVEVTKSKSQLKAERRAKQEAQRALKVQKKIDGETMIKSYSEKTEIKPSQPKDKLKNSKAITVDPHKVKVFSHLYRNSSIEESRILSNCSTVIHKSVIQLGIQYKEKIIIGGNARVIAFLNALKQVLADYKRSAEQDFSRGFETVLTDTVTYLDNCRPISVSMTNAVKHIKRLLSRMHSRTYNRDEEAREVLRNAINTYLKESIDMAGKAICIMVQKKISENDVILTFGYSSLIERILAETFQIGIKFRVIIVDAGPFYEGKELLRRLVKKRLQCTYVLLAAASYIMKEATKVLLGAHAILTNGYVMSRAGSSQVALIAKSYNVPVLICCETHKFSERVQTDAFVYNELGNPDKLMKTDEWKSNIFLTPLTLMYDVTPSDLVTAVVTELAILPCTSVPVILRVKPPTNPVSS